MTKPGRRIDFWGDLIKELREEQGFTQRQLATRAGVNRTTLRRIENGGEKVGHGSGGMSPLRAA